jgi:hypothetical protein
MSEKMYTTSEYLEKNPTWHVKDSPWKTKQILNIIERNKLQPSSICEAGCGAGEILNQMYLQMPNKVSFVGYEISPQAFELCQQRKKDRLQFHLKNLFQDNKVFFDIVLAIDVIEHVEDYFGFLRSLREKGQYKIFHIPLDISVQTVLRSSPILKGRQSVGHIHYFTKETALATLADTGYEILDYFYTAGSIDLPAKSFKSLLARLPRKILYKLNKDTVVRVLGGYSLMVLTK